MKHIEFEKLLEKFEGLLTENESREISAHLAGCTDCAAQSAKLENFFSYATDESPEDVGQAVTARLLNIFQPKKKIEIEKQSFGKRLLATLSFDDWQTVLNERFIFSDTRQLLYKAENYDIDLRLSFIGDKCQLSGQILPDCKATILEITSENVSARTELNENSEFVFPLVSQEIYDLRIYFKDFFIEISQISLLT